MVPAECNRSPGRLFRFFAALTCAVTVAAGCGGAAGDSRPQSGLTRVDVGILPIVPVAPLLIGVEKGFFKEEGLDVRTHSAQGGAALVPAVVSGQYQFAFSNNVSLIAAAARGLPLGIVAAANSAGRGDSPIEEALVVRKDSGLTSVKQLEGKTIAVNTLKNIVSLSNKVTLEKADVNPSSVRMIEVGFPEMPHALESGRVDAIDVAEPFLTIAKDAGARVIARPFRSVQQDLYISSWFTTTKYANDNPDVTKRFVRALERAKKYATAHPEEVRDRLPKLFEISPDVAQRLALSYWPEGLPSRESLDILARHAVEYGIVSAAPDVQGLLIQTSKGK